MERLADGAPARIVNQDIHSAEMLQYSLENHINLVFIADICVQLQHIHPILLHKPVHIGPCVPVMGQVGNCQAASLLGQDRTAAFADTPSASGHNRNFSF